MYFRENVKEMYKFCLVMRKPVLVNATVLSETPLMLQRGAWIPVSC